jgi:uncharacterized membrane protein YeiB
MMKQERLQGLDLARYFAFVGMVIVNFKIAMGAEADAGLLQVLTGALEGRAAATFVVLAGVGLGLSARQAQSKPFVVTLKRALYLLVIGLLNMTIFSADILHYYAFYFFFGAALLSVCSWTLAAIIVCLNLAFVSMIFLLDYNAGWNWVDYTYSGFWTPNGFVRNLFFNGWHPVIPWLGFLLFGIILSRMDLGHRSIQWRLMCSGFAAVIISKLLSGYLIDRFSETDPLLLDLLTTRPIPPMPLYTLAGLGAASIVIGGCLLVAGQLTRIKLFQALMPADRQTLTLYVAHMIIGMGTLEALGMLGGQSIAMAVSAALIFCAIATVYAALWSRWFKHGPLESLMRVTAG